MNPESDTFSFDHDTHTYRNAEGLVRPSVTQTLQAGGLFNYSRVDPALLERKRIIGSNVHAWTAAFDETRADFEMLSISEDEQGYACGWMKFRNELEFEIIAIEQKMVRTIAGVEMGGTLDRKIRVGRRIFVLEIKCVAAFYPSWQLQLADYVMLDTERTTCSAYGRAVVRLRPDGTYRYNMIDPSYDAVDSTVALAFLQTYAWKVNHGISL